MCNSGSRRCFITSPPLATIPSAVLALVGMKFCVSKDKLGSNWAENCWD